MEDYEQLLKKAMEKLPDKGEHKDRFAIPDIVIEAHGAKTIIKNFGDISAALRRNDHLVKFFFRELAVRGSVQNNSLVLDGKFPNDILKKKLDAYVKEFVLCKKCTEPDTKILKEKNSVFIVCEACGTKYAVRSF